MTAAGRKAAKEEEGFNSNILSLTIKNPITKNKIKNFKNKMIQIQTTEFPRHATSMNIGKHDLEAYLSGYNVGEGYRLAVLAMRKQATIQRDISRLFEECTSRFWVMPQYIPSDPNEIIMFDFGKLEGFQGKSTLAKISGLVDLIVVD